MAYLNEAYNSLMEEHIEEAKNNLERVEKYERFYYDRDIGTKDDRLEWVVSEIHKALGYSEKLNLDITNRIKDICDKAIDLNLDYLQKNPNYENTLGRYFGIESLELAFKTAVLGKIDIKNKIPSSLLEEITDKQIKTIEKSFIRNKHNRIIGDLNRTDYLIENLEKHSNSLGGDISKVINKFYSKMVDYLFEDSMEEYKGIIEHEYGAIKEKVENIKKYTETAKKLVTERKLDNKKEVIKKFDELLEEAKSFAAAHPSPYF